MCLKPLRIFPHPACPNSMAGFCGPVEVGEPLSRARV
jgi:hypothetical protein